MEWWVIQPKIWNEHSNSNSSSYFIVPFIFLLFRPFQARCYFKDIDIIAWNILHVGSCGDVENIKRVACIIIYQYQVDSCFGTGRLSRFKMNPFSHWALRDDVPEMWPFLMCHIGDLYPPPCCHGHELRVPPSTNTTWQLAQSIQLEELSKMSQ